MLDWDVLRYVLAIRREGGLSGAARVLGVNHATVSRQLAKAESAAGTALFLRLSTGLEPTEAGQESANRAALIEAEVMALERSLAGRDARMAGPLTITAPPLVMQTGLADDIAEFHLQHPDIELTLRGSDRVLDLNRREADVAIRVARAPSDTLWGRVVTQQRAGWFASQDWLDQHGKALISGDEISIIGFLGWAAPMPLELKNARVVATSDDMVSAAALARAGMGMVRMPAFLGQSDADLCAVPGLKMIDYWPIWALTHPDLRRAPRVLSFIRFVAARFAQRGALYMGE